MIIRKEIGDNFKVFSIEHGKAFYNGEHKKANELHKKLHELYNEAKKQNTADVFEEFLNDEDESVRLWAAIFTLKFSPQNAERVLEQLSEKSGIKMTAKITLDLWKQGKLNLL